jgi:AcrR family transcriptional regulator
MPRPREIDDGQILGIARKMLMEKGLGVPTRALAAAAGISEGVLYQRFKSKHGLIQAALSLPRTDPDALIAQAAGHADPARAFEDVLAAVFGAFRQAAPSTLPRLQAGPAGPSALDEVAGGWPGVRAALERHFVGLQRLGRMSLHPAADVAFLVAAALQHAALVELVSGPSPAVSELAVRRMARALWAGLGSS